MPLSNLEYIIVKLLFFYKCFTCMYGTHFLVFKYHSLK